MPALLNVYEFVRASAKNLNIAYILSSVKSLFILIVDLISRGRYSQWLLSKRTEAGKVKVIRQSLAIAIAHCWVHLLPIAAEVTLVGINIHGHFVGVTLPGSTTSSMQSFYQLLLQVTAKMIELLITASMGSMLFKIVFYQLVLSEKGIPFGLWTSHRRFLELAYLTSGEFWSASRSEWRRMPYLPLFVFVMGLLALLVQPFSALLLIPTRQTDWPAGGGTFYLAGNESSIFGANLTLDSAGGSSCRNPTFDRIKTSSLSDGGCAWGGFAYLAAFCEAMHLNDGVHNVTMFDGRVLRSMSAQVKQSRQGHLETWALGPVAALGPHAINNAALWNAAISLAPLASQGPFASRGWTSASRLKFRELENSYVTIPGRVPAVRVNCGEYTDSFFNTTDALEYPVLPLYDTPSITDAYWIQSVHPTNLNNVTTFWVTAPKDTELNNDSMPNFFPTAFLRVNVPYQGPVKIGSNDGLIFTCSIDARWAVGETILTHVGDEDNFSELFSRLTHTRAADGPFNSRNWFLAPKDGSWTVMHMSQDWLDTAVPSINSSSPGLTTLSAILEAAGFDNKTGMILHWADIAGPLEHVLSLGITDAISRIGYAANGGSGRHWADAYENGSISVNGSFFDSILKSQVEIDTGYGRSPRNTTRIIWKMSVAGLAINFDGPAKGVAVAVLLSHTVIALSFIIYTVKNPWSTDSWDSFAEMMTLVYRSETPSDDFRGTTAIIRDRKVFKTMIAVRARVSREDDGRSPNSLPTQDQSTLSEGQSSPQRQRPTATQTTSDTQSPSEAQSTSETLPVSESQLASNTPSTSDAQQPLESQPPIRGPTITEGRSALVPRSSSGAHLPSEEHVLSEALSSPENEPRPEPRRSMSLPQPLQTRRTIEQQQDVEAAKREAIAQDNVVLVCGKEVETNKNLLKRDTEY